MYVVFANGVPAGILIRAASECAHCPFGPASPGYRVALEDADDADDP